MTTKSSHLGPTHPLAEVAARLCASHSGPFRGHGVGRVACGACWEQAIRADERVIVEHELAHEITPDPSYVDDIAVELACQGRRVRLSEADQAVAVARLAARGWSTTRIAQQVNVSYGRVARLVSGQSVAGCCRAA